MKVKKLIEKLQSLDPEKMVVLSGYEGGHSEADTVEEIRLRLDVNLNRWYYGDHEEDKDGECHAIYIG